MINDSDLKSLVTSGVLGAAIGLGQLLASGDQIKVRHAIGRATVSSGIAMSAYSVMAFWPDAPPLMLVGISCLLSSLGTSGLTMLAKRLFNTREEPSSTGTVRELL